MKKLLLSFMILIGSTSLIKAVDFGNLSGYFNEWKEKNLSSSIKSICCLYPTI